MKIKPQFPEETYGSIHSKRGDAFVYDVLHKKDLDDLKKISLVKWLRKCKLPGTIEYNDSINIFP